MEENKRGYDLSIIENWNIDKDKVFDDKKRSIRVTIKLTEKEMAILKLRMVLARKTSMSDFIRTMIIGGKIKIIDTEHLREYARQLSAIGNNINQLARKVNMRDDVMKNDEIELLKNDFNDMKRLFFKMYEEFNELRK